jgi:NAD(P)H-hydrate repair Nnr-like enzyme with NAD(P)H-hydrate dehydratase domain
VTASIVLLTEQALSAADAERLAGLHTPDSPQYRVLVPADTQRSLLADVLDHLSLLELREALEAVRGHEDVDRVQAGKALDATLTELKAIGARAEGVVVDGDPVAALEQELSQHPADEVVIVTRPHAVEDTFHTDWASRARERLGVPVLHVYAGSSWLG